MFELSNSQRPCFGLVPIPDGWQRMELKPSPYDNHTTVAYRDGTVLRKYIASGDNLYMEREICEQLSEDLKSLLPKTAKGKPVPLTATTLEKRTGQGMCLSWSRNNIGYTYLDLYSQTSQKAYYSNSYEALRSYRKEDFRHWVDAWCNETIDADLADIAAFAAQPREHQKWIEGDVFRFKINRHLYGYGRVLLNYTEMRRRKEPFWDILMGKPQVCSVYHIVTERKDVTVEELKELPSLPSVHIMDNKLFYGEFEVIGHLPITDHEDYPIMYGNSISALYRAVLLQCGRLYRRDDNGTAFSNSFTNHSIGFDLRFELPVLPQCIETGSNDPYWAQNNRDVNHDLRNPKNRDKLEQVCSQFGLSPAQLLK